MTSMHNEAGYPGLASALDEAAIVAITDHTGAITYCNNKFCDISGYSQDELIGANHRILNSGHHDATFFSDLYSTISKGRVWRGTIRNRRKDGSIYWVDTTIVPALGADLKPESYTSIRFEVTAHIKALADLATAREAAERAVQAKNDFIANMSHEVRTPLNGVIGLASALAAGRLSSREKDMVDLIQKSGEALRRILDDILDLSKIQAEKMPLVEESFDLQVEVKAAAELMRPKADEKGLTFSVAFDDKAEGWFIGDAVRIRQIISNLASNAVKFTESGTVSVRVSVTDDAEASHLAIDVEDTGIGFDADAAPRLFNPFVQADASIARRYGGTGLGLSISRAIAELMGGEIAARSEIGVGSLFQVRIPVRRAQESLPAQAAGASSLGERQVDILLVEDHPTNQMVVAFLLDPFGVNLTIAENGLEALKIMETMAFDIVLMDMQMPVMDGLAAIREIRALESRQGKRPIPIAMMTANTSDAHHREAVEVGADHFIAKPVTLETLLKGIEYLLALKEAPAEAYRSQA